MTIQKDILNLLDSSDEEILMKEYGEITKVGGDYFNGRKVLYNKDVLEKRNMVRNSQYPSLNKECALEKSLNFENLSFIK